MQADDGDAGDALSSTYEAVLYKFVRTSIGDNEILISTYSTHWLILWTTSQNSLFNMPSQVAQPADADERQAGLSVRTGH